ncbi:hypothetical protein C3E77_02580 [Mycetocola zhujimingii]|nr:hypothetical protein [Mycetocola zhujimingii]AWB85617.1 hypothetical protein C3E77_02580 [Mycetocola zhujimingii]
MTEGTRMSDTGRLAKARDELRRVRERIDQHPLNDPAFLEARSVIAEHQESEREVVAAELARRNLPSLGSQSRALVLGLTSLARLNRKRIRLEEQIAKLESA